MTLTLTRQNTRAAVQPLRTGVTEATYDNANEMLTFKPVTGSTSNMTYDNNGNLTSMTNSCGTTTYTWNARNQLIAIITIRLNVHYWVLKKNVEL